MFIFIAKPNAAKITFGFTNKFTSRHNIKINIGRYLYENIIPNSNQIINIVQTIRTKTIKICYFI